MSFCGKSNLDISLTQCPSYLLTYDAFDFHEYLESLIAANTISVTGGVKQHQSPWMLTDAANVIFQSAQRRCYLVTATQPERQVVDLTEDDDAWAALDEAEGFTPVNNHLKDKDAEQSQKKPSWVPSGLDPVLEELPKWNLLAQIIYEAEAEMIRQEHALKPGARREYPSSRRHICRVFTPAFSSPRTFEYNTDYDFFTSVLSPTDRVSVIYEFKISARRTRTPLHAEENAEIPRLESANGRRPRGEEAAETTALRLWQGE